MALDLAGFVQKWTTSAASERANKDAFLIELCDVLGVDRPNPTTGDNDKDTYVFERDARFAREGAAYTIGKIDLYKAGHLILEAKQGSDQDSKKVARSTCRMALGELVSRSGRIVVATNNQSCHSATAFPSSMKRGRDPLHASIEFGARCAV